MNKEKNKSEIDALKKKGQYPVQKVLTNGIVSKKDVKDAVKGINPDENSMDDMRG